MRFFMITTVAASVAAAIAAPSGASANALVCSNTAVCCTTDISGSVNLDCVPPTPSPGSIPEFIGTCNARNQNARCCALVIAGQGILCNAPA